METYCWGLGHYLWPAWSVHAMVLVVAGGKWPISVSEILLSVFCFVIVPPFPPQFGIQQRNLERAGKQVSEAQSQLTRTSEETCCVALADMLTPD